MTLPTRRRVFDLVGESKINSDGRSRQDVLLDIEPGDPAQLVREPANPHDPNAILVTVRGEAVGYVKRVDAAILAPAIDAGRRHGAIIHCLRGGVPDYPSYGCQISIAWDEQAAHPHVELDDQQHRSRRGKSAVRSRKRLADGRFESERSGCFGSLGLLALAGAAIDALRQLA